MDFSDRAKALRGAGVQAYYGDKEAKAEAAKAGLTAPEYWTTMVHTYEDALIYMDLYYPAYPDCLKEAVVKRMTELRTECLTDPALYRKHVLGLPPLQEGEEDAEEEKQPQRDQTLQELAKLACQRHPLLVKRQIDSATVLRQAATQLMERNATPVDVESQFTLAV